MAARALNETQKRDKDFADSLSDMQILDLLRDAVLDGDPIEVADGCVVHEPDGTCRHGHRSPLRVLGLI